MEIVLYKTTDKPNTIKKKLTEVKTIEGQAIEPISIISPVIKVKVDEDILEANYVGIEKFNRFYFIKDIVIDKGFMTLTLTVDVLESFKEDILAYNGIIERQEYDYNLDLEDNEIKAFSKSIITYKKFPNSIFNPNLVENERKFCLITTSD